MKILILNSILRTADKNIVPVVNTIKDSMIYSLSLGFKNLGHEVTLVAADDYRPTKEEAYDFEVIFQKTYLKKIFKVGMLPLQWQLINYLKKYGKHFDLIISSELFAFPSLFAAIIVPKNTIIWQEMNIHPKLFKKIPSRIWYHVIVKLFMQKSLVVPRSADAGRFVSQYAKNVSRTVVEHGVNLDNFRYSKEKKNQFIVVSQLIPRKNIESIIDKFHRFIQKYNCSEFKLLIVGKGILEEDIRQQIKDLNLQENVELLGYKPHAELGQLVASSMAMLVDTRQDLNMVSIPEAIVCGTPVVTNMVPTTAVFIHENQMGIAKTDWDEDDLYHLIQKKDFYIDSCIRQRHKLSTEQSAQLLIDSFFSR